MSTFSTAVVTSCTVDPLLSEVVSGHFLSVANSGMPCTWTVLYDYLVVSLELRYLSLNSSLQRVSKTSLFCLML